MKIKAIIKILENDGWYFSPTKGSHRQFKHLTTSGLVTVSGKLSDKITIGTHNEHFQTGGVQEMRYLIVIEETKTGFSAYSPDVDGCVATGKTKQDIEQNMQQAMEFHLQGLAMENQIIPHSHTYSNYVEVEATV